MYYKHKILAQYDFSLFLMNMIARALVLSGLMFLLALLTWPQLVQAQTEKGKYPYNDTMVISAYYSPLPDQERYVTGSYDGDVRLNGSGVNGADGTAVYPGMVAAPSGYPFGFKMIIPGIGTVAVHDRGGAIKGNRLDIWMGYGDKGLKRALNWGKRTVNVEMLGLSSTVKESVYLEGFYKAEKLVRKATRVTRMFPEDIWYQSEGERVTKLQEALGQLGYFNGEINGFYGDETLEAIFSFQVKNRIISDWSDLGAGHCGVQTRATLERALNSLNDVPVKKRTGTSVVFSRPMKLGDKGGEVIRLQEELRNLSFLRIVPTGNFGEITEHAVFKFQQRSGLVKTMSDDGAGVVGPKTRAAMNKVFSSRSNIKNLVAAKVTSDKTVTEGKFIEDIDPGVKSYIVRDLQEGLKRLGYFNGDTTVFFGPQTKAALIAFQLDKKIIQSEDSRGAGRLGPQTRSVLNEILESA